jgi:hypothetical protein
MLIPGIPDDQLRRRHLGGGGGSGGLGYTHLPSGVSVFRGYTPGTPHHQLDRELLLELTDKLQAEWDTCDEPHRMLEILGGEASERKLRLFACACCRRIEALLPIRFVLEIAERFADGLTDASELAAARQSARCVFPGLSQAASQVPRLPAWQVEAGASAHHALDQEAARAAHQASRAAAAALTARAMAQGRSSSEGRAIGEAERAAHARLLRDIFGNPWWPASIPPPVLAWNGDTVPRLAQSIYEEHAFDRTPILADALEEAGCQDADILGHLRGPGAHTRGCFVVDALLGRS